MRLSRGIVVAVSAIVLVIGGAIAFAFTDTGSHPGARLTEVAIHEQVVLLPSDTAGVGGWCLATLGRSEGGQSDCKKSGPSVSEGPIVVEMPRPYIYVPHRSAPSEVLIVLTTGQVAAVSFEGYEPIATHANALLPDHMRGAVLELRGRAGESRLGFPHLKLVAWSKSSKPIARTIATAPPLTFGVQSRSWSRGQRAPRGICNIRVSGLNEARLREKIVMSTVRPRGDVRGREFVNCVHVDYVLAKKWSVGADVLLDAAHPGTTPARLPGIRPLLEDPGVFTGPSGGGTELACRISGAWLLVTKGEDMAQRLAVLEHLDATVNL